MDAAIFNRLHIDIHASANEFRQEIAQSPAFWSLTLQAYKEVVLVRLIRAYDTNDMALSLQSWLQTIKTNLHFFGAEHGIDSPDVVLRGAQPPDSDQLNQDIAAVTPANDPLVKKLVILRGNLIAHTNAASVVEGLRLEDRFPFTYEDIDALVSRATAILNRYSVLFKRTSWLTKIVGQEDYRNVLEALRTDLKQHDAQIADDIERAKRAASLGT